jgi:hypothetical protein
MVYIKNKKKVSVANKRLNPIRSLKKSDFFYYICRELEFELRRSYIFKTKIKSRFD